MEIKYHINPILLKRSASFILIVLLTISAILFSYNFKKEQNNNWKRIDWNGILT